MSISLHPGSFLVASPELKNNPHFGQRVVLILSHSAETGTAGVVVNRPLDPDAVVKHPYLTKGLEHWSTPSNRLVFVGGPMNPQVVTALHRIEHLGGGSPLLAGVYRGRDLETLHVHASSMNSEQPILRYYLGFANWASGQLEKEMAGGCWRQSPGSVEVVFSSTPEEVWPQLLSESEGK